MKIIARVALLGSIGIALVSGTASQAGAEIVVGTFDASRAGLTNVATGPAATQMRASLAANFPDASFATAPTLTGGFLSGVDVLVLTPFNGGTGITPLSAAEQTAMLNFVMNGGRALLLADGLQLSAAQSLITPFGMTIADDNLSGLQLCTPTAPSHPVISGPFGTTTVFGNLGGGILTNLGPYSTTLGTMDANGQPVLAAIEAGAISPGSGRVLIYGDATLFADPIADGFFSYSETLFLNSFEYLVPEPSTFALAAFGIVALGAAGFRRRRMLEGRDATT